MKRLVCPNHCVREISLFVQGKQFCPFGSFTPILYRQLNIATFTTSSTKPTFHDNSHPFWNIHITWGWQQTSFPFPHQVLEVWKEQICQTLLLFYVSPSHLPRKVTYEEGNNVQPLRVCKQSIMQCFFLPVLQFPKRLKLLCEWLRP